MKLKLSDYSSIADVIAAIAIIISLIYVGIQISYNTRATRSANANSATSIMMAAYATITSSTESSEIWFKGMTDPSTLDDAERVQFFLTVHATFLAIQNSFYLSKEGTLDAEMQEGITNSILAAKDSPGLVLFWSKRRSLFTKEFQIWVDEILASDSLHESSNIYRMEKRVEP